MGAANFDFCSKQLDRVLAQFGRIDGRVTAVQGADLGMIGLLALNLPHTLNLPSGELVCLGLFALATLLLIGVSLVEAYRCQFPIFEGGYDSLIYFREIAKRTEQGYIDEIQALDDAKVAKEILGQVWRNSQILTMKFDRLKRSMQLLGWGTLPWVITLAHCAIINTAFQIK